MVMAPFPLRLWKNLTFDRRIVWSKEPIKSYKESVTAGGNEVIPISLELFIFIVSSPENYAS